MHFSSLFVLDLTKNIHQAFAILNKTQIEQREHIRQLIHQVLQGITFPINSVAKTAFRKYNDLQKNGIQAFPAEGTVFRFIF